MKASDCIAVAKEMIGEGNENTLLLCLNNCLDEIACEYAPSYVTEKAVSYGGIISFSSLSNEVADVVNVTGDNGNVPFEVRANGIYLENNGIYVVKYAVRPTVLSIDDEVALPPKITCRILCYGIIAEYYLISGMFEEAVTWDKRFKDALCAYSHGRKEHRVKQRRWML